MPDAARPPLHERSLPDHAASPDAPEGRAGAHPAGGATVEPAEGADQPVDDLTQPLTRQAARRQEQRVGAGGRGASAVRRPSEPRRPSSPVAPGAPAAPRGSSAAPAPTAAAQAAPPSARGGGRGAIARASALMAAGTAFSRVLGFVRAAVLATVIGANTNGTNSFAVANTIPNTLYLLIAGGVLNAILVPQVVKAMKNPDGGADYVNRLVTAAVAALAFVTALLVVAAPLIVGLATVSPTGGSSPPGGAAVSQQALTVAFAVWCLPQVFFYALYTLLGQILNARGSFGAYMWAPAINNVVAVVGLAVFALAYGAHPHQELAWTPTQVAVLGGTSTLGVVAQALVLLSPLRRAGVRLRPRWGLRGVGLGSAGRSTLWVVAGLVLGFVAFLATSRVASYAREHRLPGVPTVGYAVWGNAYLIFMLPHSLVAVSIVTALFTRMSASARDGALRAVRSDVSYGLRTIAVMSVLGTAGLLVLARPAGVVLTGANHGTGVQIGLVIAAMAVGMVPFSANYLLQRAFYALEDARTPFFMQGVSIVVWLLGSLLSAVLLAPQHVVAGAALSMSGGQVCSVALGTTWLRERLGGLDLLRVARTHARLVVAALLAAAVGAAVAHPLGHLVDTGRVGAAVVAALAGTAMVLVYGAALALMRVDEVRPLAVRLARPLKPLVARLSR